MTTNSQLSKLNLKKQKQTKQTTRTGTESQKWRAYGGLSAGRWKGENEGKGTGNKKHKWQVENRQWGLRIVQEIEKPQNLYARAMDRNWGRVAGGKGNYQVEGGERGKNWGNSNSIINKIYFKKEKNETIKFQSES